MYLVQTVAANDVKTDIVLKVVGVTVPIELDLDITPVNNSAVSRKCTSLLSKYISGV